jgi:hypothetical protein
MERRLFDPGHATGFLRAGDRDLSELETGDVAFRGQTDAESRENIQRPVPPPLRADPMPLL